MLVDRRWEEKMLKAADSSRSCLRLARLSGAAELPSVGSSVCSHHLLILSADWFLELAHGFSRQFRVHPLPTATFGNFRVFFSWPVHSLFPRGTCYTGPDQSCGLRAMTDCWTAWDRGSPQI